jgi:hypothetical protein
MWFLWSGAKTLALIVLGLTSVVSRAITLGGSPSPAGIQILSDDDGFTAKTSGETIRVIVCSENVVHILAIPDHADVHGASPAQPWMQTARRS